ncbi:MAG: ABC transporter substrate-binding protein [Proteobacteria bacterium]|nr:ABC transporter substrate-binding protein [Pseudomonadota bacterium]
MKRLKVIPIIVVVLVFISGTVVAQASPIAFLKAKDRQLDPLLKNTDKNKRKIIGVVNKMLNFNVLCQQSLGKHWDTRTPDQQKEFTETLKALIEKNLVNRLKDSKDHKVTYESEAVTGATASVLTLISSGDDPRAEKTEIEYILRKKGKGWRVTDMVTDGVSLVSNYRSQFNKIITEDGWDVLMQKMKDKLVEQE